MNAISEKIMSIGVVPVIKLNNPERDAVALADALIKGGVPVDKINEYSFVVFGVSIRNSVDGKTTFCYTAPTVRFDYGDGMGRFNAVIPFITGGVTSLEVKYEGKYLTGMNYDPTHELGDTIILKEIIGIM